MHRRLFIALVMLLSTLALTAAGSRAQDDGDVPMFRGNAARTGEMPGPGPDPANGVMEKWRFTTGGSVDSSPAVVDGMVYVASRDEVYALDAATGIEQWQFNGDRFYFSSSPAVVDGGIYIGGSAGSGSVDDGIVYATDAATGTERWRYTIEGGNPDNGNVRSSPVVVDGVVYVGRGDGTLYALNAATGIEQWRFHTGNAVQSSPFNTTRIGYTQSSPAVVDGVVFIGSFDGGVYALDAATGTELWWFPTTPGVISTPAVVDGVVYVGSWDGNTYALDAETGMEQWRFTLTRGVEASPAVADGVVYLAREAVYAVDAATGDQLWRSAPSLRSTHFTPVVADDVVYVSATEDDNLYALDAATGTELWQFTTEGTIESPPAVVDGVIYVGSNDDNLYALEAASPPQATPTPSAPPPMEIGATAEVTIDGTPLYGGPAESAVVRAELAEGTRVTITGEAELDGETEWWPVTVEETGMPGWIKGQHLQAVWPDE